jgi:hypothetical protein
MASSRCFSTVASVATVGRTPPRCPSRRHRRPCEIPCAGGVARATQRAGADLVDPHVDGLGELVVRQRTPRSDSFGERRVELGHGSIIGHQIRAIGDDPDTVGADFPCEEQHADSGEPVARVTARSSAPDARPWLALSAAATSAVAASQSSRAQSGCSSVHRRRSTSAMAASLRASAARRREPSR